MAFHANNKTIKKKVFEYGSIIVTPNLNFWSINHFMSFIHSTLQIISSHETLLNEINDSVPQDCDQKH